MAKDKTEIQAAPEDLPSRSMQDAPPSPVIETLEDGTSVPVVEIVAGWPNGRRHYVVVED